MSSPSEDSGSPRNVLLIAYHFPPLGGGGVQRAVGFVRALGAFGYRVTVVTGTGVQNDQWTPPDPTLERRVPAETTVHRVPGPEPRVGAGWRRRAERLLAKPEPFGPWWIDGARRLACQVGTDADVVIGELVPYATAGAAAAVAAELGKPWVADLQDPWAVDEMWVYPSAVQRKLDERRMARLLASAAAVVTTAPEATRRIDRFLQGRTPVTSIPNGFDTDDFAGAAPPRADGRFRVVHTGYFHTELSRNQRSRRGRLRRRLGGLTVPAVDFSSRTPAYLVEAIREVTSREPELAGLIDVHLAGVLTAADRELVLDLPNVTVHGYLAHEESVALLRSADLLFLPMHDLPAGTRAGLIPGKTFEYLASGKPILAAVPEGDARDLLAEAGGTEICAPSDVGAIAAALERELRRWSSGAPAAGRRDAVVARYERRALTGQLAAVLDRVIAGERAPNGRLSGFGGLGDAAVASRARQRRPHRAVRERERLEQQPPA